MKHLFYSLRYKLAAALVDYLRPRLKPWLDASVTRELRKAAKRTEKNLDKIIKTIEQAKKKAGDEAEIELYEMLIGILKGGGENDY